jgi:hypothetical protein
MCYVMASLLARLMLDRPCNCTRAVHVDRVNDVLNQMGFLFSCPYCLPVVSGILQKKTIIKKANSKKKKGFANSDSSKN